MNNTELTNLELASDELRLATNIINSHKLKESELLSKLHATLDSIINSIESDDNKTKCTYEIGEDMNWINFDMRLISLKIVPDVWINNDARCELKYYVAQCINLPIAEDLTLCNTILNLVRASNTPSIILSYNQCVNDPEYVYALNNIDRLNKSYLDNVRKSEFSRLSYAITKHTGIGVSSNPQYNKLSGYAFILYKNDRDVCYKFVPTQLMNKIFDANTQSDLKNTRLITLDIDDFIKTIYLENGCAKLYTLPDALTID